MSSGDHNQQTVNNLFFRRIIPKVSLAACFALSLAACSMQEEVRRIEEVQKQRALAEAGRTTNLTGEQIFVRSCNTCHPGTGSRKGRGPILDQIDEHFPTDLALREYLRKGKGIMPGQPLDDINEKEMDGLIIYLRDLTKEVKAKLQKK